VTDDVGVGVLVIRAWCESGSEPFRARMLAIDPAREEVEVVGVASSASEVVDIVRDWLARCDP